MNSDKCECQILVQSNRIEEPLYVSLRVLYMPPVYAVVSFFSYRYFRSYTYYSLAESGALWLCCLMDITHGSFTAYEVSLVIHVKFVV